MIGRPQGQGSRTVVRGSWNLIRRTAEGWLPRMEAGEFATIQELAEAVGLAERHVSRRLRLAYLAPEVLKRLTCGREPLTVSLYDLCFLAGDAWVEQEQRVFD